MDSVSDMEKVESMFTVLDSWLAYQVYFHQLPGLSVGIALGRQPLFRRHYGFANLETYQPITSRTMYRIASHSKLFTATAIMRLKAAGRLGLDDPVVRHLDWFRSAHDSNLESITLRQLLTHSSGVVRDGDSLHWSLDEPFPKREDLIPQTQAGISIYQSDKHWKYSNFGYSLLGSVIEAVTGQPYSQAVMELVVRPLGLEDTRPDFDESLGEQHAVGYGRKYPGEGRRPLPHVSARDMSSAAGFSSTLDDLLAFYQAHRYGVTSLLPDSEKREMQRVQYEEGPYAWGLGFACREIGGISYVGHGGRYPGFITFSGLSQALDMTLVVLTNAIDGPARALFAGLSGLLHLSLTKFENFPGAASASQPELEAAAGIYRSLWGDTLYGRIGDALVGFNPELENPAAEMDIFEPLGSLRYRIPLRDQVSAVGETIRFLPGEGGEIKQVVTPGRSAIRVDLSSPGTPKEQPEK